MTFHLEESTWETSTTTGTGDYILGGAVSGWRAFSAQYANADTCWYSAYDGSNFEQGIGTYNSGANSLTRTTIYRSTNSNAAVNWSAGTRNIVVAPLGITLEGLLDPSKTGFPKRTAANTWSYVSASTRTRTVLTSGSGTYTTPANCVYLNVRLVGGGGGGGGSGTSAGAGTAGNNTTFGSSFLTGNGGVAGSGGGGGSAGGTASGGDINTPGGASGAASGGTNIPGGFGGGTPLGAGGGGGSTSPGAGGAGATNSGGGGGGAGDGGTGPSGSGGGGGGYVEKLISSPAGTYSYAVGGTASGGSAGTGGAAGGAGAAGIIIVDEYLI
jgi:hypothetical protein